MTHNAEFTGSALYTTCMLMFSETLWAARLCLHTAYRKLCFLNYVHIGPEKYKSTGDVAKIPVAYTINNSSSLIMCQNKNIPHSIYII